MCAGARKENLTFDRRDLGLNVSGVAGGVEPFGHHVEYHSSPVVVTTLNLGSHADVSLTTLGSDLAAERVVAD